MSEIGTDTPHHLPAAVLGSSHLCRSDGESQDLTEKIRSDILNG